MVSASTSLALDPDRRVELTLHACEELGVECTEEDVPIVRYGPLLYSAYMLGAVNFDSPKVVWMDLVFLDQYTDDYWKDSTFLHETVHSIMINKGMVGRWSDPCEDIEAPAWRIANTWLVAEGRHDLARWHWREDYPLCQLK